MNHMPNQEKTRPPSKFYFSSQYKTPFHRNEDRLSQIDFRTFDPFVPEARQTVANCKKHRRQRHELSDKCKHVLAAVDAQERLLSTRPEAQQAVGYSAQGATMRKPEISIEFGDGIPEIAKEYVKFWIEQSGMVKEPYSRQYDVHNIKDEHNHAEKPSVVLMAPFMETDITNENQLAAAIKTFFENPKAFTMKGKVGNLRIYSINKKTQEEDAVGYVSQLPIKIIGKEIITKNLQKASDDRTIKQSTDPKQWERNIRSQRKAAEKRMERVKARQDHPEDGDNQDDLQEEFNIEEQNYLKLTESLGDLLSEPERRKLAGDKRQLKIAMDARTKRNKEKEYNTKQSKILRNMLSPENNIAPNRMGEGTNPIGYAVQVAETPFRMVSNLLNGIVERKMAQKERKEDEEYQKEINRIEGEEYRLTHGNVDIPQTPKTYEEEKQEESPEVEETPDQEESKKKEKSQRQVTQTGNPQFEQTTTEVGSGPESVIQERMSQPSNPPPQKSEATISSQPKKRTINENLRLSQSEKYLNTTDLIIIAKLKRGGV
jgi:hypothetical protein